MTLESVSVKETTVTQNSANESSVTELSDSIFVSVAKQRKTRRGKKKKHKIGSGEEDDRNVTGHEKQQLEENENEELGRAIEEEQKRLEAVAISSKRRKLSSVIIRPIHVPKAPENSTQFIIDDHEDSHLYISFDKPFSASLRTYEDDAAFQDIDYEYESPDDFDFTDYYARDFEDAYYQTRFDVLMQLSHNELKDMYHKLEEHAIRLQDQLVQCDPKYVLDDLQEELLKYQEENKVLRRHHKALGKELKHEVDETDSESSSEEELSFDDLITDDEVM